MRERPHRFLLQPVRRDGAVADAAVDVLVRRLLHDPDRVAVRAMVRRDDAHRVMDDVSDLGARAILVTGIHACRL